jgi:hypothetical protein
VFLIQRSFDDVLTELNRLDAFTSQMTYEPLTANSPTSSFSFDTHSLLSQSALYSCSNYVNVIVGIDFTASNEWKGRKTFSQQSLHKIAANGKLFNPYQRVISYLSTAVTKLVSNCVKPAAANADQASPLGIKVYAYGFGDSTTRDRSVFSFADQQSQPKNVLIDQNDEEAYFESFDQVITRYNEVARRVNLSGPTSFAPIIYKSIDIIRSKEQQVAVAGSTSLVVKYPFHMLFIVADGKVTAENEVETIEAIIEASEYPLSIVMIGVGDGPFDTMIKFDDRLGSKSRFDNFQFVDFNQVVKGSKAPESVFAVKAFMEIPEQFKLMKKFNYV